MASLDVDEEARYVEGKQNGKKLQDRNNFTYRKNSTHNGRVYYNCTEKKTLGCEATAIVQGDNIIKKSKQHNSVCTKLVQEKKIDYKIYK